MKKIVCFLLVASFCVVSFADVTITVKNSLRQKTPSALSASLLFGFLQNILLYFSQEENKDGYAVKICRADNDSVCTNERMLMQDQYNSFLIADGESKFADLLTEDGFLKSESLVVNVNGNVCGYGDESDKPYYPSKTIPFGADLEKAREIEIHITRAQNANFFQSGYAICRMRYFDASRQTKLAMIKDEEILKSCHEMGHEVVEPGKGAYHFNGYLPVGHFLAKGIWDEDYRVFELDTVRWGNEFSSQSEFCAAYTEYWRNAEVERLGKKFEDNVKAIGAMVFELKVHRQFATWDQMMGVIQGLRKQSWSPVFDHALGNWAHGLVATHNAIPDFKIPELDGKSVLEKISILESAVQSTQPIVEDLTRRRDTARLIAATRIMHEIADSFHHDSHKKRW